MVINGKYGSLVKYIFAALILIGAAQTAAADCRQALVLGLDVSGSVDDREYLLQQRGLAHALTSPEVAQAFFAMPNATVDLAIFEWSGQYAQTLIQPWITITSPRDLDAVAQRIMQHKKSITDLTTAIGASMSYAQSLLAQRPECWQATFDISGDGKSNTGPRPQDIRARMGPVIVNALVVGADPTVSKGADQHTTGLTAYFRAYVVDPSVGFVETAAGFSDYQSAMERKLIKELQVIAIGSADGHK